MSLATNSDSTYDNRRSTATTVSTSSVITVKRAASPAGDSIVQVRSASPAEGALLAARALKASTGYPVRNTPTDLNDLGDPAYSVNEGLATLDRWSQSTNSSLASPERTRTARPDSRGRRPLVEEREKPWRKQTSSPKENSGLNLRQGSPRRSSPSQFRPPSSGSKLDEYRPGRIEGLRPRTSSNNSSRGATPTLGPGGIPRLRLTDIQNRPHVPSPLSPPIMMRPITPSATGLLTPASTSEPTDYFGLGIAVSRDGSASGMRSPGSPMVHSRYTKSSQRTPESPQADKAKAKTRERREKDKKTMLSKALEKANTAVLLDNAQNFEGALEAYSDACRLLLQVMERTGGEEDKRKLDAIRETYSARIEELTLLQRPPTADDHAKQLPPRPTSNESEDFAPQLDALHPMSPLQDPVTPDDATPAAYNTQKPQPESLTSLAYVSPRQQNRTRDSFLTDAIRQVEGSSSGGFLGPLWERSKSPGGMPFVNDVAARSREELASSDAPRPLTPIRSQSPAPPNNNVTTTTVQPEIGSPDAVDMKQLDGGAGGQSSWLNTIDESDSDSGTSLHSGRGGTSLRRKDLRFARPESTSDFDAAFDAAVEAAYEDGYEPDQGMEDQYLSPTVYTGGNDASTQASAGAQMDFSLHEEPLQLDEGLSGHGFDFNLRSAQNPPRESDSSSFSKDTWSSGHHERNTTGTSLTTLSEDMGHSRTASEATAQAPPLDETHKSELGVPVDSRPTSSGSGKLQERRNPGPTGSSFKPLKIETAAPTQRKRTTSRASQLSTMTKGETSKPNLNDVAPWEALDEVTPWAFQAPVDGIPKMSRTTSSRSDWQSNPQSAVSDSTNSIATGLPSELSSPQAARYLRGKKSSMSLRDGGVPPTPSEFEFPPPTPASVNFGSHYRGRNDSSGHLSQMSGRVGTTGSSGAPPLPDAAQMGGYYLFDTTVGTVNPGTSPRQQDATIPPTLEPCPESSLLRPFWLLRCISSTVMHPKGGYLTNRIFMPREAWLNRSVKLKSTEDKMAACDLLTAALGRLSSADTYDAEAVLEELQTFEDIMERVQGTLIKRLGGEVGVQGVGSMFRDAAPSTESPQDSSKDGPPKTHSGKLHLSSWRKLRGKNSIVGTASLAGGSLSNKNGDKESHSMSSVPMTSYAGVEKRGNHKKDAIKDSQFDGPHKEYMASIARLCEAAQALDQIARQVEDPGLKHSSPTHVGLELSTRHAAEFFGFYICRFMLADIGVLLDKYVKRSTEWVLT